MTARAGGADRATGGPLAGRRIVLTRPREQAESFEERVRALGGVPVVAPAIAIAPPASWAAADAALDRLGEYDWMVFTSANAVRAFAGRAGHRAIDIARERGGRIAAVGPATATALAAAIRPPDVVADVHSAEALGGQLPVDAGARVLFPCGAIARDALPRALRERGASVEEVVVYRTVPGDGVPAIAAALRDGSADAVLFASPSAVRFVAEALAEPVPSTGRPSAEARASVFCLGPTTEEAARSAGLAPAATAPVATQDELIDEVARWFAPASPPATRHEESVR